MFLPVKKGLLSPVNHLLRMRVAASVVTGTEKSDKIVGVAGSTRDRPPM